jgi:hypothetical protein
MAQEYIDFFEACRNWLDGHEMRDQILWGHQMLWWGRFGKFLTLIAGVLLIVEIIGSERWNVIGEWIEKRISTDALYQSLKAALLWPRNLYRRLFADHKATVEKTPAIWLSLFLSLAAVTLVAKFLWTVDNGRTWWELVGYTVADSFLAIAIATVLSGALVALFYGVLWGWAWQVKTVAWILENKDLETWAKLGTLVVGTIGVLLDILAS